MAKGTERQLRLPKWGGVRQEGEVLRRSVTLAVVLLLVVLVGCNEQERSDLVEVPSVVGMREPEAIRSLSAVGLAAATTTEDSDEAAPGTVVAQTPEKGKEVEA